MRFIKIMFGFIMLLSLASCENDNKRIGRLEGDTYIIEEGVEEIKRYDCAPISNATTLYLPKSIKKLDNQSFFDLGIEFKSLYYGGSLEDWCMIEFGREYANPMQHGFYDEISFYYMDNGKYKKVDDLIIPNGVKRISNYAFSGFTLNNVRIPSSVEYIGESAFQCSFIKGELTFDNNSNLKEIGRNAFEHSSYNGSLVIPDNVSYIGRDALLFNEFGGELSLPYLSNLSIDMPFAHFVGCYNVKKINITKGTEIGLFAGNPFTGHVAFPDSVTRIKANSFHASYTKTVYFSPTSSLKEIEDEAFSMSDLKYIFLPEGVEKIHESAFMGAYALVILSHAKSYDDIKFLNNQNRNNILINDKESGWYIEDNKLFINNIEVNNY